MTPFFYFSTLFFEDILMRKLITALLLFSVFVMADEQHTLTLDVSFSGTGTLNVYLVDKTVFPRKGEGIVVVQKDVSEVLYPAGVVSVSFDTVPAGEYGVRAFIDENGNGTLDRGAFGPKEPWGMSFSGKRSLGPPKFSEISFELNQSISKSIVVK